jgi:hypothetical protein
MSDETMQHGREKTGETYTCDLCGKPFIIERCVEVTYTSRRRIEDMPEGWRGNHVNPK